MLAELYGAVVIDTISTFFMGATDHTNNTAELTAVGEAVLWLIFKLPTSWSSTAIPLVKIVIHSDNSDYAINTCTGKWSAGHFNVQLYLQIRHFIDDLNVCIESLIQIQPIFCDEFFIKASHLLLSS